jgi:8-oxo-dGTP pyrophosphatase MutT (NUDIX family)
MVPSVSPFRSGDTRTLVLVPIPDFIVALRALVGPDVELWLPGVTAVVERPSGEVLLVRRSDDGEWGPVTGILDPGEEPAVAARREVMEEAGVEVRVDRLASVSAGEPMVHANGDRAIYLDHTYACTWVAGEAHVADDESVDVGWFRPDDLPPMQLHLVERITVALAGDPVTRFRS